MDKFVEKLISDLNSNNQAAVQESLLQTSFIFEKHRGVGVNWDIERQITSLGWSREVAATHFSDAHIAALKSAVIDYFERNPENENAASALSALSALMDARMKQFFVKALRIYVDTDPAALYQAMIGLEDIGEDVFAGRRSKGITMTEVNVQLAREYLERQDQKQSDAPQESFQ
jgi:hypothetical protein